jgi:hypothetical protein
MSGERKAMGAGFHYSFALTTTPIRVTAVFPVDETGNVPDVAVPGSLYKNKLRGLSPQANYTDPAPAACRRS